MHLGCCLIGLIVGLTLGLFIMKLKTRKLHQQKILQEHTLKKNTQKLNEYQEELSNYFNQNIELLDIIASNYRKLYQHMVKSSHVLLTHKNTENISDDHQHRQHYNTNDLTTTHTNHFLTKAPRDYPENNNQTK